MKKSISLVIVFLFGIIGLAAGLNSLDVKFSLDTFRNNRVSAAIISDGEAAGVAAGLPILLNDRHTFQTWPSGVTQSRTAFTGLGPGDARSGDNAVGGRIYFRIWTGYHRRMYTDGGNFTHTDQINQQHHLWAEVFSNDFEIQFTAMGNGSSRIAVVDSRIPFIAGTPTTPTQYAGWRRNREILITRPTDRVGAVSVSGNYNHTVHHMNETAVGHCHGYGRSAVFQNRGAGTALGTGVEVAFVPFRADRMNRIRFRYHPVISTDYQQRGPTTPDDRWVHFERRFALPVRTFTRTGEWHQDGWQIHGLPNASAIGEPNAPISLIGNTLVHPTFGEGLTYTNNDGYRFDPHANPNIIQTFNHLSYGAGGNNRHGFRVGRLYSIDIVGGGGYRGGSNNPWFGSGSGGRYGYGGLSQRLYLDLRNSIDIPSGVLHVTMHMFIGSRGGQGDRRNGGHGAGWQSLTAGYTFMRGGRGNGSESRAGDGGGGGGATSFILTTGTQHDNIASRLAFAYAGGGGGGGGYGLARSGIRTRRDAGHGGNGGGPGDGTGDRGRGNHNGYTGAHGEQAWGARQDHWITSRLTSTRPGQLQGVVVTEPRIGARAANGFIHIHEIGMRNRADFRDGWRDNVGGGVQFTHSWGDETSVSISDAKFTSASAVGVRPGYRFAHWGVGPNPGAVVHTGVGSGANALAQSISDVRHDIPNVHAQWHANSRIFSFDSRGSTTHPATAYNPETRWTGRINAQGINNGHLPVPERRGYTFQGWFTSATDGSQITDGQGYPLPRAATGGIATNNTGGAGNGMFTAGLGTNAHHFGNAHRGEAAREDRAWFFHDDGEPTPLFAQWLPRFADVTWNANDGSIAGHEPTTQNPHHISEIKTGARAATAQNSVPIPYRQGYAFGGWFTTAQPHITPRLANETVAQYNANRVTYPNGYLHNNVALKWTATVADNNADRQWAINFVGTGGHQTMNLDGNNDAGEITLFARWIPIQANITFVSPVGTVVTADAGADIGAQFTFAAGTSPANQRVYTLRGGAVPHRLLGIDSTSVERHTAIVRPGYTFDGWFDSQPAADNHGNENGRVTWQNGSPARHPRWSPYGTWNINQIPANPNTGVNNTDNLVYFNNTNPRPAVDRYLYARWIPNRVTVSNLGSGSETVTNFRLGVEMGAQAPEFGTARVGGGTHANHANFQFSTDGFPPATSPTTARTVLFNSATTNNILPSHWSPVHSNGYYVNPGFIFLGYQIESSWLSALGNDWSDNGTTHLAAASTGAPQPQQNGFAHGTRFNLNGGLINNGGDSNPHMHWLRPRTGTFQNAPNVEYDLPNLAVTVENFPGLTNSNLAASGEAAQPTNMHLRLTALWHAKEYQIFIEQPETGPTRWTGANSWSIDRRFYDPFATGETVFTLGPLNTAVNEFPINALPLRRDGAQSFVRFGLNNATIPQNGAHLPIDLPHPVRPGFTFVRWEYALVGGGVPRRVGDLITHRNDAHVLPGSHANAVGNQRPNPRLTMDNMDHRPYGDPANSDQVTGGANQQTAHIVLRAIWAANTIAIEFDSADNLREMGVAETTMFTGGNPMVHNTIGTRTVLATAPQFTTFGGEGADRARTQQRQFLTFNDAYDVTHANNSVTRLQLPQAHRNNYRHVGWRWDGLGGTNNVPANANNAWASPEWLTGGWRSVREPRANIAGTPVTSDINVRKWYFETHNNVHGDTTVAGGGFVRGTSVGHVDRFDGGVFAHAVGGVTPFQTRTFQDLFAQIQHDIGYNTGAHGGSTRIERVHFYGTDDYQYQAIVDIRFEPLWSAHRATFQFERDRQAPTVGLRWNRGQETGQPDFFSIYGTAGPTGLAGRYDDTLWDGRRGADTPNGILLDYTPWFAHSEVTIRTEDGSPTGVPISQHRGADFVPRHTHMFVAIHGDVEHTVDGPYGNRTGNQLQERLNAVNVREGRFLRGGFEQNGWLLHEGNSINFSAPILPSPRHGDQRAVAAVVSIGSGVFGATQSNLREPGFNYLNNLVSFENRLVVGAGFGEFNSSAMAHNYHNPWFGDQFGVNPYIMSGTERQERRHASVEALHSTDRFFYTIPTWTERIFNLHYAYDNAIGRNRHVDRSSVTHYEHSRQTEGSEDRMTTRSINNIATNTMGFLFNDNKDFRVPFKRGHDFLGWAIQDIHLRGGRGGNPPSGIITSEVGTSQNFIHMFAPDFLVTNDMFVNRALPVTNPNSFLAGNMAPGTSNPRGLIHIGVEPEINPHGVEHGRILTILPEAMTAGGFNINYNMESLTRMRAQMRTLCILDDDSENIVIQAIFRPQEFDFDWGYLYFQDHPIMGYNHWYGTNQEYINYNNNVLGAPARWEFRPNEQNRIHIRNSNGEITNTIMMFNTVTHRTQFNPFYASRPTQNGVQGTSTIDYPYGTDPGFFVHNETEVGGGTRPLGWTYTTCPQHYNWEDCHADPDCCLPTITIPTIVQGVQTRFFHGPMREATHHHSRAIRPDGSNPEFIRWYVGTRRMGGGNHLQAHGEEVDPLSIIPGPAIAGVGHLPNRNAMFQLRRPHQNATTHGMGIISHTDERALGHNVRHFTAHWDGSDNPRGVERFVGETPDYVDDSVTTQRDATNVLSGFVNSYRIELNAYFSSYRPIEFHPYDPDSHREGRPTNYLAILFGLASVDGDEDDADMDSVQNPLTLNEIMRELMCICPGICEVTTQYCRGFSRNVAPGFFLNINPFQNDGAESDMGRMPVLDGTPNTNIFIPDLGQRSNMTHTGGATGRGSPRGIFTINNVPFMTRGTMPLGYLPPGHPKAPVLNPDMDRAAANERVRLWREGDVDRNGTPAELALEFSHWQARESFADSDPVLSNTARGGFNITWNNDWEGPARIDIWPVWHGLGGRSVEYFVPWQPNNPMFTSTGIPHTTRWGNVSRPNDPPFNQRFADRWLAGNYTSGAPAATPDIPTYPTPVTGNQREGFSGGIAGLGTSANPALGLVGWAFAPIAHFEQWHLLTLAGHRHQQSSQQIRSNWRMDAAWVPNITPVEELVHQMSIRRLAVNPRYEELYLRGRALIGNSYLNGNRDDNGFARSARVNVFARVHNVHNTSVTDVLQWLDDARYLLDGHDFTTEVPPPYRSLSELVVILRDLDETIRGNLHTQGGWPAGDAGRALWNEAMGIAHPGHQNLSHAQFEALRNAFPRTTSGGGIVTRSFNNVYYHALGLYNRRSGNNAVTSLEVNNFITELGRVGGMHPWSGIMRTANLLISETMPAWESNIRRVPATIRTVNTYYQRMRRVLEHEHTTHQGQPVGHAVIFNAARDALAVTGRHTNVVVTPGRNTGILMYQIREAEERFTRPVAIPAQNLPVGLFNNPLHRWPDALLSGSGANRWPTSRLAIGIRYGINVNYGGGVYGGRIDKVREMAYRFNDRGTNAADTYLNMTSHMNRSIVTIDQLVGAEINITTSLTRLISTDMRTTATEAWAGVTLPADLPEHTPLDTRWVRGGSGGNRAPVLQGLYDTVRIARTYHIPNAELNTQMQSLILRGEQMLARYELPASNAQSIQNLFPAANTRNADAREVIIGIRRIAATIQRIDPATGLLIEEGINNAAINNLRLLVSRISEYQAELNNTTLGLTTLRDLHATVTVLLGLHPSPQPMLSGEALNFDEQLRALVIAASGPEPDQGIIPHDGHGLPNSRTDLSYYLAQIQDLVDAMNEILLGTDGLPETRTIVAALRNEGQGILDETVHARDILVEYIQRASSFLSNNGFGSVCPDTGEFIQTPNYEVRFAAQVHLLTVIEIMEDYLRPWSSLVTDEARVDTRAALEAQLASARIAHANAMSVPSTTTNNIVASLNSFVVFENITIIIPVTSSVLNETIMVPLPMGALHGQLNELEVLLHDITRHIPTMTDLSLVVALEAKLESTRAAEIVFAHQNLGHNNVYEVWRARRALEQFLLDYEIEIDRTPPGEDTGDQPLPDPRPDGEGLGMMLWIIIAVVLLLVLIIGFIIAKRKKKKGKSSYNY